ncbi:Arc family DNA-binding protein [Aminobacter anthyllidis]|uniref:Arc family DNA-binding protein n=1 Tax=Aminobacter anthyllidis TaxID=1035067 RepID=A0A9X1D868_9HYPH|nr:Arc family DNA-binding protein [Aminobacter anthyllidis]MBT1158403.1 Arc family DNA-binding protein [Aminobacter anthyllidis]MDH4986341.1 Arc family DNA-binding protein [Aminobacter anthyllidis]
MGDLLIRNIPEAVKESLADKARQGGRSLSDEVTLRLAQSLAEEKETPPDTRNAFEVLRSIFQDNNALMSEEDHADFMQAVDGMRKDEGRPLPELE